MLFFEKDKLNLINLSQNAVFCFIVAENDYINLLKTSEKYFNLNLTNRTYQRSIEIQNFIYLLYKFIHKNVGFNPKEDKNTIDILGKEFVIKINKLIYNPNLQTLFALVNLKNNWTCCEIPHIMISHNNNTFIDESSIIIDIDIVLNLKLCLFNSNFELYKAAPQQIMQQNEEIHTTQQNKEEIHKSQQTQMKQQKEEIHKSQKNKEEQKQQPKVIYKPLKPKSIEDDDEIIILPKINSETIYTGRNGAQYKIVNGKKRYIQKK